MVKHNSNPLNTYKMGLNQFSAMTDQEFAEQHLSKVKLPISEIIYVELIENLEVGDIDWTLNGAVGPTKNQGQCSPAWVFSTTGPLQGLSKIADGTLKLLSDQQLIDCATIAGQGCNGGFGDTGFKWVKLHGITTADKYPFVNRQQTCAMTTGEFKISGYTTINSCNDLSTAIHKGPVSVLVDATNWSRYASGIFSNCGTSLNHAGNLVGQIQENWKVQNSWGTNWGENGFIRLAKGNTCGICTNGIIPFK
jgi:cathepsin L